MTSGDGRPPRSRRAQGRSAAMGRWLPLVGAAVFAGALADDPALGSAALHSAAAAAASAPPRRLEPKRMGGRGSAKSAKDGVADSMKAMLDPSPDPNSPHELFGFEPRNASGDNIWAFGRAHAVVHHVLDMAPVGDAGAVADAFNGFAQMHGLDFGLPGPSAQLLDDVVNHVVRQVSAMAAPGANGTGAATAFRGAASSMPRGVKVLVLDSGLGGRTLRCLPSLMSSAPFMSISGGEGDDWRMHEVVSIESNPELSGFGARLVSHALGLSDLQGDDVVGPAVRHLPLMPGEETTLDETMETLRDGYDLPSFDLVLLGDQNWDHQQGQLETLLRAGALAPGAVVHAEGAAPEVDPSASRFVEGLSRDGREFESKVHQLADGKAAVVSTLRQLGPKADEL